MVSRALKQKILFEQRRDIRAAARTEQKYLGNPAVQVYYADGYHGGITFWDWIILPGGGTWKIYNWPVVAEPVLERVLSCPSLAAVFELDAHTYGSMETEFPAAIKRIKEALATGRLEVVNGTFAQPLSGTYDGETYVRHFFYGLREIGETLGAEVVTFASQEPAFFPQLPQILGSFRYRLAVLRTHWAPFGADPAHSSPLFKWQAADGSRIWAVPRYPFMHYGKGGGANVAMHYGEDSPDYFMGAHLLPQGYAGHNAAGLEQLQGLSLQAGIDRPLLTRLEDFNVLSGAPLKGVYALSSFANVHFVTLQRYLDLFDPGRSDQDSAGEAVYFSSDQFPCYYPWGLQGAAPLEAAQSASRLLLEAERLDALAHLCGGEGCREQLDRAWKLALHSQHHDLHLCGPWLSRLHRKPMAEVAVELAYSAKETASAVIDRSLQLLVNRKVAAGRAAAAGKTEIVALNSLAHPRRDVVCLPLENPTDRPLAWKAYSRGEEIAAQWVPLNGTGGFLALLLDLPGFEGDTIEVVGRASNQKPPVPRKRIEETVFFDNAAYRAVLEPNGQINLQGASGRAAIRGGYLTVWAGGWWHDSRLEQAAVFLLSTGPVADFYAVEGTVGDIPFVQEIAFFHGLPRVDFQVVFDFGAGRFFGPQKEESAPGKAYYVQNEKKLNLNFITAPADSVLAGGAYLVEQRKSEDLSATGFIAAGGLLEGEWSLLRPGTCGYRWVRESGLLQAVLAWAPREWLYASEDSIRVGGSKYTMLRGKYSYRYALLAGVAEAGALVRAADDFANPFLGRTVSAEERPLDVSTSRAPLQLNPDAPTVTALFAHAGKTYLRLCNYSQGNKELFFENGWKVRPVNLRLEPEGSARPRISLAPGKIQTLQIIGREW